MAIVQKLRVVQTGEDHQRHGFRPGTVVWSTFQENPHNMRQGFVRFSLNIGIITFLHWDIVNRKTPVGKYSSFKFTKNITMDI
jgi:hypothetical protein